MRGFFTAKLFFFISLLLWIILLPAQKTVHHFNRLTSNHNLTSQNFNFFIYHDSENFVWISSQNGLNLYDGNRIKQYLAGEDDPQNLASNNIEGSFF